jgi:uncharacterized membrane protein YbhN (UPF0104 family)
MGRLYPSPSGRVKARCKWSGVRQNPAMGGSPRGWRWAVRLAVSVGIVVYILVDVDWSDLESAIAGVDLRWLGAATAVYLVAQLVSATKWSMLGRALGFDQPWSTYVRNYYLGMFFNLFGPSTIGGDFARALYLSRGRRRGVAINSVLFDRLSGLAVLMGLAATVLAVTPYEFPEPLRVVVIGGGAALLVSWWLLPRVVRLLPTEQWLRRMVEGDLAPLWRDRRLLARVAASSLCFHLLQVGQQWLVARAVGIPLSFGYCLAFHPLLAVMMAIPVSISGFGVREGGYLYFLTRIDIDDSYAAWCSCARGRRSRRSRSPVPTRSRIRRRSGAICRQGDGCQRDLGGGDHVAHPQPLLRGVDGLHARPDVHHLEPAAVQHVRVAAAAHARRRDRPPDGRRGGAEQPHDRRVVGDVHGLIGGLEEELDGRPRGPSGVLESAAHVGELGLELREVVAAGFAAHPDLLRDDVDGAAARDRADVRGRLVVDPAERHAGDRGGRDLDRAHALLGRHAGVRRATRDRDFEVGRPGRAREDEAGGVAVEHEPARGADAPEVEVPGAEESDFLADREDDLDRRVSSPPRTVVPSLRMTSPSTIGVTPTPGSTVSMCAQRSIGGASTLPGRCAIRLPTSPPTASAASSNSTVAPIASRSATRRRAIAPSRRERLSIRTRSRK